MAFLRLLALCLALFHGLEVQAHPFAKVNFSKHGPRNFGVLVHNAYHTIYRSEGLGKKGLAEIERYLKQQGLPYPTTIIHMNFEGYGRKLFHPFLFALEEMQLSDHYGYKFYHTFGYDYSTYLDGENPYEPLQNVNSNKHLGKKALSLIEYNAQISIEGGMDAFYRILDLVLQSEGPVLFHCTGGRHRTGMVALAIRYLQGGDWRFAEGDAMNPAQREYLLHNPSYFRRKNLVFIERWQQDPQFKSYERAYQASLNAPSLIDFAKLQ